MYNETNEIIRERMERMCARFLNAGFDVLSEFDAVMADVAACDKVEQCLEKEKLLIERLDHKFPANLDDLNDRLHIGQFTFQYSDAKYNSQSQQIA